MCIRDSIGPTQYQFLDSSEEEVGEPGTFSLADFIGRFPTMKWSSVLIHSSRR